MSCSRLLFGGWVLMVVGLVLGCAESPAPQTGWGLQDLPDTPPYEDAVFKAAQAVILERYPMSACSRRNGFLTALTPIQVDGASRTRKQISVVLLRNFTGAYEPVVKVRQYVENSTPYMGADPGSGNTALARPLDKSRWQVLDYLPYEEQAVYEAILKEIAAGESPQDSVPTGG